MNSMMTLTQKDIKVLTRVSPLRFRAYLQRQGENILYNKEKGKIILNYFVAGTIEFSFLDELSKIIAFYFCRKNYDVLVRNNDSINNLRSSAIIKA